MSAERPHHPFGPSQLSSLRACACYEGEQSKTPHARTIIGTKGHDVIESGVDDNTLADEDADMVVQCRQLYAKHRGQMGPGCQEIAEEYLAIDDEETTAGYLDAAIISADKTRAVLLDWKLGIWPVEPAADNLQIKAYALGLFRAYPTVETIDAAILQPPISDEPTAAVFTRAQVPEIHDEIWAIVARAKAARAAGDFSTARAFFPNCNFCSRIGSCPVVAKLAGEVGHKYAPLLVPEELRPEAIHDPARIKEAWQLAAVVKTWAEAFRTTITDRVLAKQCEAPPGYKLTSTSKRKIADAEKYKSVALQYLTEEQYNSTMKPALTDVEELISAQAPRCQKTATVEKFAEAIEEVGAVVKSDPYTFLKAVPQKQPKTET